MNGASLSLAAVLIGAMCNAEPAPDSGPEPDSGSPWDAAVEPDASVEPDAGPLPVPILAANFTVVPAGDLCETIEGEPVVVPNPFSSGSSLQLSADVPTMTGTLVRCPVSVTQDRLRELRFRYMHSRMQGDYGGSRSDKDHWFRVSLHAAGRTVLGLQLLFDHISSIAVRDYLSHETYTGDFPDYGLAFDTYHDVVVDDFDWENGNARLRVTTASGTVVLDTRTFVQPFTETVAVELATEMIEVPTSRRGRTVVELDTLSVLAAPSP